MPFNGTSGVQCRPMPRAFARRSPSICARSSRSRIRLKARWLPCGNSPLFENLAGSEESPDWIRQQAAGYGQCLLRVKPGRQGISASRPVYPLIADMRRTDLDVGFVPKAAIGPKVPVSRCTHGLSPLPRDLSVILFEH